MASPNLPIAEIGETPLVKPGETFHTITEAVSRVTENRAPKGWWVLFLVALTWTGIFGMAVGYLFWQGVGVWGNNTPATGVGTSPTSSGGSVSVTPAR
jgi:hypothetical protein